LRRKDSLLQKRNLPTVDDVAKSAGVSTATVSRCLNEPQKVSKDTRERVMAAVEKLHYAPNFGARAIAANRTGTFGAIIPTMENAIFARGIEAFQQEMVKNNATMLVASSAYNPEQETRLIRTMVARGADGMLLIGTDRDPEIYEFLKARNIPFVIAWAISNDPTHSYVGFDNRAASRKLVSSAIALGHQKFAYIAAKTVMNDRARERVAGAIEAIEAAGFDRTVMPIIETDYSIDNGMKAFDTLMQASDRPSLIVCGNDVLAVGAIQAAQARGLSIPSDISTIGFDDIELSRVINPALTTMHVPHKDMGTNAAKTLLKLVEDPTIPMRISLDTRIVERDSLASPKQ
jgi:LacI family transcriptional regulator